LLALAKEEGLDPAAPSAVAPDPAAEEKAAAEAPKPADAPKPAVAPPAVPAEPTAEQKAAAEKSAAEKAAADAAAADPLDKIELPPHTKPKSAEAFNTLKQAAKDAQAVLRVQLTEITNREAALKAEVEQLRVKTNQVPENITKELEELRKFRLTKDVESDPKFKELDGKIRTNTETIYKKLEVAGLSKDHIEKIKELGGPESVDWEPILPKLPLTTRRFIEATLVENERIRDERDQALEGAKSNAETFKKEREEREVAELVGTANDYLKSIPWTAEKAIPANATPEQKAAIEADNQIARESSARLKEFLSDRSPSRFAELAVGTVVAYRHKAALDIAQKRLDSIGKDTEAKITALTAERDKLQADLTAIRRAEAPRSRTDSSGVKPMAPKGSLDFRSGRDALEELAKEEAAKQDE
jgi:hypothetical protein